jgi:hypothetical protein
METEKNGAKKAFQRARAALRIRYCEDPNVHRIVTHGTAEYQGG